MEHLEKYQIMNTDEGILQELFKRNFKINFSVPEKNIVILNQ